MVSALGDVRKSERCVQMVAVVVLLVAMFICVLVLAWKGLISG